MQHLSIEETGVTEPQPAPIAKATIKPLHVAYLVLIIALAFVLVDNARWLSANTAPPAWDEARYLVNSLEAYDYITHPSLKNLGQLYMVRHGVRPSIGYVWLAVPIYALFGTNPDAVTLWTNFFLLVVIALATFSIGRRLFNTKVGLLAGVLVTLNPEVIRLTRVYWPHLGVVAVTTLGVYLLILSDDLRHRKYIGLLGLLLAMGLMLRPIYPALFLAGPIGFVFISVLVETFLAHRNAQRSGAVPSPWRELLLQRLLPAALLIAVPPLVIALPFYLQFGRRMFQFVDTFQTSGTFAPVQDVSSLASFAWYFVNLRSSIGLPFFWLFVGGLIVYLFALVTRRVRANTVILLAWLVVSYIALSLQATKEFFYLAPLYPAMALILAFAVLFLLQRSVPLQLAASTALAALSILLLWQVSWGQPLPAPTAKTVLAVPSRLPNREVSPLYDLVGFIGSNSGTENRITVGTVAALPQLAEPALAYYAKVHGLDINFIRATDPVPTLLDADYVIVKTGPVFTGRLRSTEQRNADLVAQVLANPASVFYTSHQRLDSDQPLALPDGSLISVYKRTIPVNKLESDAIANELLTADPELLAAQQLLETPRVSFGGQAAPAGDVEGEQLVQEADAYLAGGKLEEAIATLSEAVERAPGRWVLRIKLAEMYQTQGQLDAAAQEAEAAVAAAGSEVWPLRTLAAIYRQQERGDEAIVINERILEIEPDNAGALLALGVLYEKKDCDKAIGYQTRAIELRPSNGSYTTLGDVLMTCGRVEDAITAYQQGVVLDASVARTHFVLARALQAQGLIQDAIQELEIVLEISTSPDLAARAQQLLDQLRQPAQP